jgi:hypothetical protein
VIIIEHTSIEILLGILGMDLGIHCSIDLQPRHTTWWREETMSWATTWRKISIDLSGQGGLFYDRVSAKNRTKEAASIERWG